MREFLAVLTYTFKENMRKKAFIISTIIIIVLSVGLVSAPGIVNAVKSHKGSGGGSSKNASSAGKKSIVYMIDAKNFFIENRNEISQAFPGYAFVWKTSGEEAGLKQEVTRDDSKALVIIQSNQGVPSILCYSKSYGKGLSPDEISNVLQDSFVRNVLKSAKVDKKTAALIQQKVLFHYQELGKGFVKSYFSGIFLCMILFFAIYFFGYGVSMSVASEKTSRVMEILVTSTKPMKIVLGKSVGMGLLGLCQLTALMLSVGVTYKLTFPKDFTLGGQRLDFSGFTPFMLFMVVVYFILGYFLYAMMNAVAGATVSKAEDVNSAIMPISMISMVSFYFAYFTLMSPTGTIAVAASLVPFSAPFSIPCRMIATDVPAWQLAASLVILVLSIVFVAWLSIRIYSSAVLHYGKRLKWKDLIKRI